MNPSNIDDYKKIVGSRIKQARIMAGFTTITAFNEKFPDWALGRIGNYENGTSLPNPLDVKRIANETDTNPCWITFGIGSIRSSDRDIQAIRYQNLTQIDSKLSKEERTTFRQALKIKPTEYKKLLNNPFLKITDTLCRRTEKHLNYPKGWMEEQHVENDGLCDFFPDDIRELMTIYSNLSKKERELLLNISRAFTNNNE